MRDCSAILADPSNSTHYPALPHLSCRPVHAQEALSNISSRTYASLLHPLAAVAQLDLSSFGSCCRDRLFGAGLHCSGSLHSRRLPRSSPSLSDQVLGKSQRRRRPHQHDARAKGFSAVFQRGGSVSIRLCCFSTQQEHRTGMPVRIQSGGR